MKEVEIRDAREKDWFWLDNEYLNGYARLLGIYASSVYLSLCRHADNRTQRCFPSMRLIAEELGISAKTVERATKVLGEWGIVIIAKSRGKDGRQANNVYTLTNKKAWKIKPVLPTDSEPTDCESVGTDRLSGQSPTDSHDVHRQTGVLHNNTHTNNTHLKKTHKPVLPKITDPVEIETNRIVGLFSTLDPANFKSFYLPGAQRSSAKKIIKAAQEVGVTPDELIKLAKDAVGVQYQPQIFNPCDMIEKMSKLIAFSKKTTASKLDESVPYTKGKYKDFKGVEF